MTENLRPATDGETGAYLNGHRDIPGAVETDNGLLVPVRGREILVIETYFLEEDVHDGDFPRDDTRLECYECDDIEDAVRVLQREGLSFKATGTEWAANPDGSYITNYATGQRVETSGHLYGFSEAETAAIVERVG